MKTATLGRTEERARQVREAELRQNPGRELTVSLVIRLCAKLSPLSLLPGCALPVQISRLVGWCVSWPDQLAGGSVCQLASQCAGGLVVG